MRAIMRAIPLLTDCKARKIANPSLAAGPMLLEHTLSFLGVLSTSMVL